jgi:hypothetical protein
LYVQPQQKIKAKKKMRGAGVLNNFFRIIFGASPGSKKEKERL